MKWTHALRASLISLALLFAIFASSVMAAPVEKKSPPAVKPAPEVTPPPVEGIPSPDDLRGRSANRKSRISQMRQAKLMQKLVGLFRAKKYADAKTVAMQLVRLDSKSGTHWYNLACAYSRLKKPTSSLKCLRRAVDLGYDGIRHMEKDEDLEPLREMKEFKDLVAMRDEIHRKRADRIEDDLRQKYGEDYLIEVDHENKLVFATNIDRQTLDELKIQLTQRAKAMWGGLFSNRFERYVTVIIPKAEKSKSMGRIGGFYNPQTSVLVARRLGMVMRHEFTHALHFADIDGTQTMHPIWVAEGFATLYEGSTIDADGKVTPGDSPRLHHLRPYLRRHKTGILERIMKLSHRDFMRNPGFHYAASRFMMAYLHDTGKLKAWYDEFSGQFPDKDATGKETWEKIYGKPIAAIELDWRTWLGKQNAPKMSVGANGPFMGVGTEEDVDGLKIFRVIPDSSAAKAGLEVGDILVGMAGETVYDRMDMMAALVASKVGDTIDIRYRRGKDYIESKLTLMARPSALSDPRIPPHTPKKPSATAPYVGIITKPVKGGLSVTRVVPNSSAAKAGLKAGDVVLKFGGKATSNIAAMRAAVKGRKLGETVAIRYRRGKKTINGKITMICHPDVPKPKPVKPAVKPKAKPKPTKPETKPAAKSAPVKPKAKDKPPVEAKPKPVPR